MTDMQYHQDNERQGRYNATTNTVGGSAATMPNRSMYPQQKRFRLVPAAVVCAFVVVGVMIFYNYRRTGALTGTNEATSTPETLTSTRVPVASQASTDTVADASEATTDDGSEATAIVTNSNGVATASPATTNVTLGNTSQTVTVPASRGSDSNINITINPVETASTTKGGQQVAQVQAAAPARSVQTVQQVVQVPVQTVQYVPANTYYTTYYTTTYNHKPATPYIENCGNFDGGSRWNDARVVLPKYESDGKAAVEYEVNVGTSVGSSDTWSHRYEQTDRVVFSVSIDDNREYFVRFRVRMDGGDFGDWSDTFRFRCHRV